MFRLETTKGLWYCRRQAGQAGRQTDRQTDRQTGYFDSDAADFLLQHDHNTRWIDGWIDG
jgi:hypothetical protein